MNILIILSYVPYPVKAGGTQAVYSMVNILRKQVHISIVINMPKSQESNLNALKEIWTDVAFFPFYPKRNPLYYLMRFFQIKVSTFFRMKSVQTLHSPFENYTSEWIEYVNAIVYKISPDIVQTEFYNNQDIVYALPDWLKKIYVQHEIHYVVNKSWIQSIDLWDNPVVQAMYRKMRAEEIAAMNSYNAVFTLNSPDKERLERDGVVSPIYCSPVGVTPAKERNSCEFSDKLIFVGTGGHPPNVEALEWFVENVWRHILAQYPNISLHVIGFWKKKKQEQFRNTANLYFEGFVSSLQETFRGGISIVPILRGSGIRMKILDAVNYGTPFISTSIGALGMGFEDGRDCFIADTAEDFTQKLLLLIQDEGLRKRFYDSSFQVFTKKYSIQALVDKRVNLYKEILSHT